MILGDFAKLLRIKQWIWKNGFVFVGFLFSEPAKRGAVFLAVCFAAFAFCLISSSVYILNDIIDREKDKMHPKKSLRPLCRGVISVRSAVVAAVVCMGFALGIGFYISNVVGMLILAYFCLNVLYTFFLKHIALLDVFCIAAGFMLRIFSGTLGVGIVPSEWLLLCGLLLTLFLGFTKRRAEMMAFPENAGAVRKVLSLYTPALLDSLITICATGVILSYGLYTMSPQTAAIHHTSHLFYTVPLVMYGIFRYLLLLHYHSEGEDPASDLLRDPQMVAVVLLWITMTISILHGF